MPLFLISSGFKSKTTKPAIVLWSADRADEVFVRPGAPQAPGANQAALVPSTISSRSNWARAAKEPKASLQLGALVSMAAPWPVSIFHVEPPAYLRRRNSSVSKGERAARVCRFGTRNRAATGRALITHW